MRILVAVHGTVGPRVTGPEIRGWEIARALAAEHEVSVAVDDPAATRLEGLRLVPRARRGLVREARAHDAVIAPVIPPYLFAALRDSSVVTVADQYDPVGLELSLFRGQPGVDRILGSQRLMRRLQLLFADVVVCASERQRSLALEELDGLANSRREPPIVVNVPFGIPPPPPATRRGALRERFTAIGAADPVVLWWGKVWRWFDAPTAIRAFAVVTAHRPNARLVISAGRSPRAAFDRAAATEEARALAGEMGLLDRNVFFLDEWVPYRRRHALLQDADVGLTLHADTAEAAYAARARYMDYLWTSLPPVLAGGDEVADGFGRAGFARLVRAGDQGAATRALLTLLEDPEARAAAREAGRSLADEYRWPALVPTIAGAISERAAHRSRALPAVPLARGLSEYYARRTVDGLMGKKGRKFIPRKRVLGPMGNSD